MSCIVGVLSSRAKRAAAQHCGKGLRKIASRGASLRHSPAARAPGKLPLTELACGTGPCGTGPRKIASHGASLPQRLNRAKKWHGAQASPDKTWIPRQNHTKSKRSHDKKYLKIYLFMPKLGFPRENALGMEHPTPVCAIPVTVAKLESCQRCICVARHSLAWWIARFLSLRPIQATPVERIAPGANPSEPC